MKNLNPIISKMVEASALLQLCALSNQADWFDERLTILRHDGSSDADLRSTLIEVRDYLAGMGSFSDLSLQPSPDSGITDRDAHFQQWKLAESLDDLIEAALDGSK